ncbi:hypothetical protein Htur_3417 [Haloterrigena turkmenica DSM 5511]|uniref:Uncharacterized protein n=1 Tax=Haloterrigena turkmenica (strain ATCC 51198 / DSM 5511 / JCM 9101 / NCIMB 13204 / VKM B-1734 / 4k) TaxID=543526 RepID=D2RQA3_HALTV|nr:hypothetical protein Htur_3417 [Haloterrigena turkmenica DSM 5511]
MSLQRVTGDTPPVVGVLESVPALESTATSVPSSYDRV